MKKLLFIQEQHFGVALFLLCAFLFFASGCSHTKGKYLHDSQNIKKFRCTKQFVLTNGHNGLRLVNEYHKNIPAGSEIILTEGNSAWGWKRVVLMVNGIQQIESAKKTYYVYSLSGDDLKDGGLVEIPITTEEQETLFSMCFSELKRARDSLKSIGVWVPFAIALFIIAVKLSDYIGGVFRYFMLLFMLPGFLLPVILPIVLYLYLNYNPVEAYWFIFDAFGYGWLGLLVWCMLVSQSIGTILGAFDKIYLLFIGVAHVIPTLITTAGAVAWGFWLYEAICLFWDYHNDAFLILILFVGAGLSGSFTGKKTTDILEDRYGNYVDSGSNMGNTFYGSGGRTYQRGSDGMFH